MKREIYSLLVRMKPGLQGPKTHEASGRLTETELQQEVLRLYKRYHVRGASLVLFDQNGMTGGLYAGSGGEMGDIRPGTCFRVASVSKMVSAALFVKNCSAALDADTGDCLGVSLRHPAHPDRVITPRMLLSHTSSIRDENVMETGIREGWHLEEAVRHLPYDDGAPGEGFLYSNVGAALCGEALSRLTGRSLDSLLRDTFHVTGTYDAALLPQDRCLADGIDVLTGKTAFQAKQRRARPGMVPTWCRAHGNLCLCAEDLAQIARSLMTDPVYLPMRTPVIPFGSRDPAILSGLGLFVIPAGDTCLYGHQGLAYGACHGVFFNGREGFVFLTTGCSLARQYVLSDLNRALIRLFLYPEDVYGSGHSH